MLLLQQYQQLGLMESRDFVAGKLLPKSFAHVLKQRFEPFRACLFPRVYVKGTIEGTS